jgi:hypothetical protein
VLINRLRTRPARPGRGTRHASDNGKSRLDYGDLVGRYLVCLARSEMTTFRIAQVNQGGENIIIVPLVATFGLRSLSEQHAIEAQLQACAEAAGLTGIVCPVWEAGGGRMSYTAPPNWHPFFQSIDLRWVGTHLTRQLSCSMWIH